MRTTSFFAVTVVAVVAGFGAGVLYEKGEHRLPPPPGASASAPTPPEQNYQSLTNEEFALQQYKWGCVNPEELIESIRHEYRGEVAAASQMVWSRFPLCLPGSRIEKGQTFTVLQVRGELAQIAAYTANQAAVASRGGYERFSYWTFAKWLEPVVNK